MTDPSSLRGSARRIFPLAWPVTVGQVAVLGFSTVDTVLLARHDVVDLAALAIGASAYVTVFVGLMGVLLAISPIAGRFYGAGDRPAAGRQLEQAIWLALMMTVFGAGLLLMPQPFLALAHASPAVAGKVQAYLQALAVALPAALMFTAYRGFNTAISRPKAVMAMQLGGLALKVPLSMLLVNGTAWGPVNIPPLGLTGCGIATAIVMWCQWLAALTLLRRDPFYRPFRLWAHGLARPQRDPIMAQLRLGVPMGLAILIEVSGFTFMAFFISRLGATPLAGHQIAVNLVALLFMLPLGLANGTSTLVAQRIGAGDARDAHRLGWHGVWIAGLLASVLGGAVFLLREPILRLYTHDATIVAAALPLLAWVALFHIGDALQCAASFVLRAWHVATVPVVIYAVALWGVGLGGGYAAAFGHLGMPALQGARGFWIASTSSLLLAAALLCALLAWVMKQKTRAGLSHAG
ncbi:MATE family efflux transporter [Ideonella sp. BN130291]|uniref:MATE family efflux transporter n=1 Tax=Ideonella sp. BN130291 TaxID=3112940 RepID=UPI002E260BE6|nr:MATE family efflux transporter [Ideonella sp. BN130291]